MNKTLTQLILSTVVMLCTLGIQAQEIDSLYIDSTDNEFSTLHMLDSVFKNVDLLQVPSGTANKPIGILCNLPQSGI